MSIGDRMNDDKKTQLGKILLKQKLVKPSDLDVLLAEQQRDHERLASKALHKGLVDEVGLLKALSEQHGVPATNLDEVEIKLIHLDLIPIDIARKHLIMPISADGETIHLAMATPEDRRVIEEIEFVSGKRVFPHVVLHAQIVQFIEKCYSAWAAGETSCRGTNYRGSMVPPSAAQPSFDEFEQVAGAGTVVAETPESDFGDEFAIEVDIPMDEAFKPLEEQTMYQRPLAAAMPAVADIAPPPPQIPAAEKPRPAPQIQLPAKTGQVKAIGLKILVVDDEDDIRLLIARVLTDKGYEVVSASRGLEAIQKVQSENPDMIILDAMLPEVHGFDICKKIKGSSKYGHIPVIMISAIYRGWRYAQDLKDSYGVDDFIEKPFKITDLVERVEKFSRKSSATVDTEREELSQEAERLLQAGIAAYRDGRLDEAVDLLKKGVTIDPLAFKLHYHLALLLGKKGLNYQAIRALENALELAPDYFPALKNLAVLYQKAGFKFKAIETWERALGYSPDDETREGIKRHLMSLL